MRVDAIDVISYPHRIIGHYVKLPYDLFPSIVKMKSQHLKEMLQKPSATETVLLIN